MVKNKKEWVGLSALLSIPVLQVFYTIINQRRNHVHTLVTDLDRAIPLVKVFVLPYMGWYVFLFVTLIYFFFRDRGTYFRTLLSIDLGMVISFLVYLVYQTTVPRPALVGDDVFTRLLTYVYSQDQPYNCFPSIHSLSSYLLAVGIRRSEAATWLNRIVIEGVAVIIILSTFLVKQHVLLDAFFAILLGSLIYRLISQWNGEKSITWIRFRRKKPYSLLTMRWKLPNW